MPLRPARVEKKHVTYIALAFIIMIVSCSLKTRQTVIPMDGIHYSEYTGEVRNRLFVFLPGRGDRPQSFERNSFIHSVREKGLDFDILVVDAHMGYYIEGNIYRRLKHDVIDPAKNRGYDDIWLVGISMGGIGSLFYMKHYPDDISGAVLMGPFLGEDEVIFEIYNSGGLQKWNPGKISGKDWQRDLWLFLKDYVQRNESYPPLFLAYGISDPYSEGAELLSTMLSKESVLINEGSHNWPTWKALWDILLERPEFQNKGEK